MNYVSFKLETMDRCPNVNCKIGTTRTLFGFCHSGSEGDQNTSDLSLHCWPTVMDDFKVYKRKRTAKFIFVFGRLRD